MPRPPSFADLGAALAAVGPTARQRPPRRSIVKALTEARRLVASVLPSRSRFAALPEFDMGALDQLPELIRRVEQAEIRWADLRRQRKSVSHMQLRDEAVSLRYRLVAAAGFLEREGKKPLKDGFHERRALPSLVADLRALADLVDERAAEFSAASDLPEHPAEAARQLAATLVRGRYDSTVSRARDDRNAALVLMELAVYEVRCGRRFLFRHEPELLKWQADPPPPRARKRTGKRSQTA